MKGWTTSIPDCTTTNIRFKKARVSFGPFHILTQNTMNVVRVGVCVLVQDPLYPYKVFAGIRGPSCGHGRNRLALPGGHLEMFETFEECAVREVHEEMGLQLDPESICQVHVSNDVFPEEKKHYVTIAMMARVSPTDVLKNRRPENLEPDKCLGWKSYSWDELTDIYNGTDMILFPSLATLVKARPPVIMNILTSTCPEETK